MGRQAGTARALAACGTVLAGLAIGATSASAAYDAAPGYAVSTFAAGFAHAGGIGPVGLAFSPWNTLFVTDAADQSLREIPMTGGAGQVVTSYVGTPHGLAFGKDGKLYMALTETGNDGIWQVDPATGALVQPRVASVPCPVGLATDPLSGDLFASSFTCSANLWRISAPGSGSPVVSAYATGFGDLDGLTFGPDGTLWGADRSQSADILRIDGTNTPTAGRVTPAADVANADGVAVGSNGSSQLMVNRTDGNIVAVDLSRPTPQVTPVMTDGTRGDLVAVGPDHCAYATQTDRIVRVTLASGACNLAPTSPLPAATTTTAGAGAGAPITPVLTTSSVAVRRRAAAAVIRMPLTQPCVRNRRMRIRIVRQPGIRVLAATISVNRRVVLVVRGARRLRRTIEVTRLPRGAYTVTVRLRLSSHATIAAARRYHACRRSHKR